MAALRGLAIQAMSVLGIGYKEEYLEGSKVSEQCIDWVKFIDSPLYLPS